MSRNRGRDEGPRSRYDDHRPDPETVAEDVVDREELDDPDVTENVIGKPNTEPNALVFTTFPLTPVEVKYRIQIARLEELFYKILKTEISDVEEVFCNTDHFTGDVLWYCRFANDSDHFTDTNLRGTTISDKKGKYLSPEIQKFASKFGLNPKIDLLRNPDGSIRNKKFAKGAKIQNLPGDKARINRDLLFVPNVDSQGNLTNSWSMRLSWAALVQLILDMDGQVFHKTYNKRPPRCMLSTFWVYGKARGDGKYGDARLLEVTKSASNSGYDRPRPREAFRDDR